MQQYILQIYATVFTAICTESKTWPLSISIAKVLPQPAFLSNLACSQKDKNPINVMPVNLWLLEARAGAIIENIVSRKELSCAKLFACQENVKLLLFDGYVLEKQSRWGKRTTAITKY